MILGIVFGVFVGQVAGVPIANVWLSPIGPLTPLRQYHMQDGSGGYRYSFTGPHHAKAETSFNGITQGGYSYIDANGILQTVTYTADDQNGFRVSASNMPQPPKHDLQTIQDTPEVAAAKRNHLEELHKSRLADQSNYHSNILSYKILPSYYSFAELQKNEQNKQHLDSSRREDERVKNPFLLSRSEAEKIEIPKPDPKLATGTRVASSQTEKDGSVDQNSLQLGNLVAVGSLEKPTTTSYVVPVLPYRLATIHSSLHHTQDSLGQYDYTYTGDSSAKTESRSLDGTTRGAYSYIDPNGILQQVHYIADHNGFRVLATNLPEAK